jgi:hypothetical protein
LANTIRHFLTTPMPGGVATVKKKLSGKIMIDWQDDYPNLN